MQRENASSSVSDQNDPIGIFWTIHKSLAKSKHMIGTADQSGPRKEAFPAISSQ